jgi:hypothetical protein
MFVVVVVVVVVVVIVTESRLLALPQERQVILTCGNQ